MIVSRTLRLGVFTLALGVAGFARSQAADAAPSDAKIDFDRQVRPILSENCFACHGPDDKARKAKLRLDTKAGAFARLRGGGSAIVAGKPAESELFRRVSSADADERMPPVKSGKKLSGGQIDLVRQWIEQGADWSEHWSFVAPKRPQLPNVAGGNWARNGIDRFVLAKLQASGLEPSPQADRVTLVRRLTLDLTGLPPKPADVDAFVADKAPDAYEKVVDRLLASPHFGERMALDWLDAARFADTHGYHIDSGRDMSKWRDWVISAFNADMPFDQFTVEQLSGDLLPGATPEQRIASGFNRNHMINFEGGAIPEEYHTAYLVDRVNTTGTVWLGLTVGCAQCHEHKFDPITQKEYYQLFAFFHNVPENGLDGNKGNAAPLLKLPSPGQKQMMEHLSAAIKDLEPRVKSFKSKDPEAKTLTDRLAKLKRELSDLDKQVPTTMVMEEMPKPRDTFVLVRGQYDRKGDKVIANVPAFLPPLPKEAPLNRLGLARWMVDPAHPLTPRVTVSRYWQMFFGTGLVKTAEDFGSQGEKPSHPELLDWLAVEFVAPSTVPAGSGSKNPWDIKAFVKLIVTSATYRQSSAVVREHYARDPENRLLARGPRLRLQAEFIRDEALAVSGLLNRDIGGKSVSPYQPAGLWEELMSRSDGKNWTAQTYTQDHGRDLYRRTMYTFWKRTCPPPTLATFDAPDRETCTVRRARTNTPLQALVLLNDPTYVEASRKLAERIVAEAKSVDDRLVLAFRLATARMPSERELAVLRRIFEIQLAENRRDP
ncbi:MAG TPA: PSD1 and planctomycete cytochrome C domain-containing protein, partial [Gemmataceae bacterium]|nr:PSD1 and planctomycete cytochrome C domain-containing protein [Gemmataceae bacterium]